MDASSGGCSTPSPWHIDAVGGRPHHHGLDRSQRANKNEGIVSQAGSRPAVADNDADKQSLEDRKARDQLIFDQNLNEVYLLIDFISGRSDRSLSSLSIPNPKGATSETFKAAEIVERIAARRYPPKMQSGTP